MRTRLSWLLLIGLFSGLLFSGSATPAAQAAFGPADFLKTNGTAIRNNSGTGAIVTLKGTNLGG